MTRDATGKGELFEQLLQARFVLADVGINFAVGAFEVGVADQRWPAVARASDVNHVEVVLLDDPVQVHVDKILPRRRSPMSQQPGLDLFVPQRSFQQRIIEKINLPDRQIIRRPPIRIDFAQQLWRQRLIGFFHHASPFKKWKTLFAIINSSSVGMTRTVTRLAFVEITSASVAFCFWSSSTPRNSRLSQMQARMTGAFSSMPPVNTSVSSP